jgi:hypothetical protein
MKQYETVIIFWAKDDEDAQKAVEELEASAFVEERKATVSEAEGIDEF